MEQTQHSSQQLHTTRKLHSLLRLTIVPPTTPEKFTKSFAWHENGTDRHGARGEL
jgi:hypothetical protein